MGGRPCLDVHLMSSRGIKFNIDPFKCAFYVACNSIFTYSNDVDEMALLVLQESYILPVLMYAVPAMSLNSKQIGELNVCWNSVKMLYVGYFTITNGNQ